MLKTVSNAQLKLASSLAYMQASQYSFYLAQAITQYCERNSDVAEKSYVEGAEKGEQSPMHASTEIACADTPA